MKRKTILIIAVSLAVIILAMSFLSADDGQNDTYRTALVTRGNIEEVVTANGTINPLELVNIGTQVSGKIDKIHVKLNDEVKAGQLLAEIDPSIPLSTLKQSRASLETAKNAYELAVRNLARKRALYEKKYIAKVELEGEEQSFLSTKNSYESVKTQVERDETNLSYTKITSPIDGVIIAQEVAQGQTMAANFQTPNLFKIATDLAKMKIDVNFAEADISKVKKNMPVSFTVDAFPERTFDGIVDIVNLNPNNQSGVVTYSVTVAVENPEKLLLPGMTAFVRVILSERKDVLRVPAAALRFSPPEQQKGGLTRLLQFNMRPPRGVLRGFDPVEEKPSIYLLKDNAPTKVEVEVGGTDETFVEIKSDGVAEGDTVITGLAPGAKR